MEASFEHQSNSSEPSSDVFGSSQSTSRPSSSSLRNKNRFKWTEEENLKYCSFLFENLSVFNSERLRKKTRIFAQLSSFLTTRTTSQVKSHHQKMMRRHHEIKNIIRHMETKMDVAIIGQPLTLKKKETKEVQLQTEDFGEFGPIKAQHTTELGLSGPKEELAWIQDIQQYFTSQTWFDDV